MVREASAYFAGSGALRSALGRLIQRLDEEGISYSLLDGLALGEHGYARLTEDIDILLTPAGLERFHSRLAEREPLYCIPEGVELGALTQRVSRWLSAHPEQAGRATVAQVTVALIASYPCSNAPPAAPDPAAKP